jgi:hypothetical protein
MFLDKKTEQLDLHGDLAAAVGSLNRLLYIELGIDPGAINKTFRICKKLVAEMLKRSSSSQWDMHVCGTLLYYSCY